MLQNNLPLISIKIMLPTEKVYYNIGEIAKEFNVTPSLIRFWCKQFPELTPSRTSKGTRKFSQENLKTFRTIYHLVKECGYTLQGAKEKMHADKLNSEIDTNANAEIVQSLQRIKQFLLEIKDNL